MGGTNEYVCDVCKDKYGHDYRKSMVPHLEREEQLQVQLAGCGVAACGGTSGSQIVKEGAYGWSPAYQDTLDLHRKFDALANSMSASEALFGFAAWLTSRMDAVTLGAEHNAAIAAELVGEFCEANGLPEPRENWLEYLTHPKEKAKA